MNSVVFGEESLFLTIEEKRIYEIADCCCFDCDTQPCDVIDK